MALLAVLFAAGGLVALRRGATSGGTTEIGKWLLQLAVVFVGAGVLAVVLRSVELARAERERWVSLLQDVVAAHDDVQLASRLLAAHRTASTYRDQMVTVNTARQTIRRVMTSRELHAHKALRDNLGSMRDSLKGLTEDYQSAYLPVARQQRLDEAVLTYRLRMLAEGAADAPPKLPNELEAPLPAWNKLERDSPILMTFLYDFDSTNFRKAYDRAKPLLEHRAGISRSAPKAPKGRA